MLIPSQIILTYVRPSYWLPGLEIGWGFVTALIALAQNAHQVYALRVLLGLFESSAWPGMMTLFSESRQLFLDLFNALTCDSVLVHTNRACQTNGLLPFMPGPRVHDVGSPSGGYP